MNPSIWLASTWSKQQEAVHSRTSTNPNLQADWMTWAQARISENAAFIKAAEMSPQLAQNEEEQKIELWWNSLNVFLTQRQS